MRITGKHQKRGNAFFSQFQQVRSSLRFARTSRSGLTSVANMLRGQVKDDDQSIFALLDGLRRFLPDRTRECQDCNDPGEQE